MIGSAKGLYAIYDYSCMQVFTFDGDKVTPIITEESPNVGYWTTRGNLYLTNGTNNEVTVGIIHLVAQPID